MRLSYSRARPKATSFVSVCRKIIEQIEKQKNVWPFRQPVRKEEVPDYYDIIKNPMDLLTVRQKIDSGKYNSKEEFEADVKLIFTNAKTYNQPNTVYYKYADEVESAATKLLANLQFDIDDREEDNGENPVKKIKAK
jgi:histone acetyltransferase